MAKEYPVQPMPNAHGKNAAHKHPPYMPVFYALVALTVLEVGTTGVINKYVGLSEDIAIKAPFVVPYLLILSVIKAVLVAMYYMHLKYDKRLYSLVIGGPFIFAMIFVVLSIRW